MVLFPAVVVIADAKRGDCSQAAIDLSQILVSVERDLESRPAILPGQRLSILLEFGNGLVHDIGSRPIEEARADDIIGLRPSGRQSGC